MDEQNINAIATIVREGQAKIIVAEDGREFALLHDEQKLQELTPSHFTPPLPDNIRQGVVLTAKDSLVEYINAFGGSNTRIFASLPGATFLALIDYHGADTPAALQHRATLKLAASEEWTRWSGVSGKLMGQANFVRFLEENMADIETPSGADILELARDFSAARKVNFSAAYRSQTGDQSFEYASEIEGRAKSGVVEVPNKFILRIPVYYGEPTIEVHAFLRFSIDGGSLQLGIELHRPDYVRQAVFEQIGLEITERTSKPLHYGSLER